MFHSHRDMWSKKFFSCGLFFLPLLELVCEVTFWNHKNSYGVNRNVVVQQHSTCVAQWQSWNTSRVIGPSAFDLDWRRKLQPQVWRKLRSMRVLAILALVIGTRRPLQLAVRWTATWLFFLPFLVSCYSRSSFLLLSIELDHKSPALNATHINDNKAGSIRLLVEYRKHNPACDGGHIALLI